MKFLRFKNKVDSLNEDLEIKSGFLDEDGKVVELKGDILDYHNAEIKTVLENLNIYSCCWWINIF